MQVSPTDDLAVRSLPPQLGTPPYCRLGSATAQPNKIVGFHCVPPDLQEIGYLPCITGRNACYQPISREVERLSVHHLVPKQYSKRKQIEIGPVAEICSACHRQIHALFDNKRLGEELNTIEFKSQSSTLKP